MATKFAPPKKTVLNAVSMRIPKKMLVAMDSAIDKGDYNRKQRSLWVREAVDKLLLRPDAGELVAEEFITPGTTTQIPLSFTQQQIDAIQQLVAEMAEAEQVVLDRSSVIRTAIIQRIMAEQNAQLEPFGIPSQSPLL